MVRMKSQQWLLTKPKENLSQEAEVLFISMTNSLDGTIRIWNHHNGELLQELIQHDKAEITNIQVRM